MQLAVVVEVVEVQEVREVREVLLVAHQDPRRRQIIPKIKIQIKIPPIPTTRIIRIIQIQVIPITKTTRIIQTWAVAIITQTAAYRITNRITKIQIPRMEGRIQLSVIQIGVIKVAPAKTLADVVLHLMTTHFRQMGMRRLLRQSNNLI